MLLSASKIELKSDKAKLVIYEISQIIMIFVIYEISQIITIFKQLYRPLASDLGE